MYWLLTSCLSSFSKVLTHGLILVESALKRRLPLLILVGLNVLNPGLIPFRTSEFDVAISIRVLGSSVYQTLVQITVVWDTSILDATIDFIHAYACTDSCTMGSN